MKKIVSLIAAVSMLFALSTSAFAFSGTVSGDATLEGTTISVGAEGFIFKFIGSEEVKGGTVVKSSLTALINDGWTIEQVDGAWCEDTDNTTSSLNSSNLLQVKYATGSNYDVTGQVMFQFKAIPGADSVIDGVTFKIQPTISKAAGGLFNTQTTYTLAKAEEKTEGPTATAGTTTTDGKITEYTFEGTDAIEKVLLFNEKVAGSAITETTRFKVTSGTRSQIFGGDIWAKLGAEGDGVVSVDNVVFGLIVNAANNAADFTFEIVK